jgi:hypothetical protein
MFTTYFAAFAAFFSLVALVFSFYALKSARSAVNWCRNAVAWIEKENAADKTLAHLSEIESTLTEHADAIASMHKTMKTLRSRIGMRELRARKTENGSDIPDAKEDPEAWKAYMRRKLHFDKTTGS